MDETRAGYDPANPNNFSKESFKGNLSAQGENRQSMIRNKINPGDWRKELSEKRATTLKKSIKSKTKQVSVEGYNELQNPSWKVKSTFKSMKDDKLRFADREEQVVPINEIVGIK